MKIKNVSPSGDLDVAIGFSYVLVPFGDVVEVSDELGASLLEQPTNWVQAKDKEKAE